jgi:hypothetical protein
MPWMSQENKKKIAAALKQANIPASFKYTLAVSNHTELVLTIKSAPASVLDDFIGHLDPQGYPRELMLGDTCALGRFENDGYFDINLNYLDRQFTGKTLKVLRNIETTIKTAGEWFDKSDPQTDYFHTAFYITIRFGRYDKPVEWTGVRRKVKDTGRSINEITDIIADTVALAKPPVTDNVIPVSFGRRAAAATPSPEVVQAALVARGVAAIRTTAFGKALTEEAMTVLSRAVVEALLQD